MNKENRREFIQKGISRSAAAGVITAGFTAVSYKRVYGANDAIRVGSIGCGGRGRWHMGWIDRCSEEEKVIITAVCDIWDVNRERGVEEVKKRFDLVPTAYKFHTDLLANKEIDAVVIATPDHLHCPHLIDAVQAGKDAYVEKPIAVDLNILNKTYDVVTASKQIVQHGTQGRSSRGAASTRAFVQSGKLGEILRIEESRSHYVPYWNAYEKPKNETETNWKKFLYDRSARPFDADQHGSWMGYADFSSGTIGGWMSHFSDFLHFVTGCGFPLSAVSDGGTYSPTSDSQRTAPDTVTTILRYKEGFTTLFMTHFGNGANNYTKFFGTKGTMTLNDPDGNTDGIGPRISGEGSEHPDKVKEELILDNTTKEDHMMNWVHCMQSRKQPNAKMEAGYMHGVACILGDLACKENRRMMFDPEKREIRPV